VNFLDCSFGPLSIWFGSQNGVTYFWSSMEIDTGISGEVALKMAVWCGYFQKNHQVHFHYTFAPVAVEGWRSTTSWYIKDNTSEKTISKSNMLSLEERIEELAKWSQSSPSASSAWRVLEDGPHSSWLISEFWKPLINKILPFLTNLKLTLVRYVQITCSKER